MNDPDSNTYIIYLITEATYGCARYGFDFMDKIEHCFNTSWGFHTNS